VAVTLDMDADLLAWLMMQPTDWQREINNTMRFFMETSAAPMPPGKPYGRKPDIFRSDAPLRPPSRKRRRSTPGLPELG
jgi:hypothetical protein